MQFAYTAKLLSGEMSDGIVDADSLAAARHTLRERGLFALKLQRLAEAKGIVASMPASFRRGRVAKHEIMLATSQLLIMCKAGVDLAEALQNVASGCRNRTLKASLDEIYQDVASGLSISAAMKKQTHLFGEAYAASIAAGEASGNVPEVLERMQESLKNEIKLRTTVIGAVTYPAVLVLVCVVVIAALFLFVLPRFEGVFNDMGVTPPIYTSVLIGFSKQLQTKLWLWALIAGAGVVFGFKFLWIEPIRRQVEAFCLRLWVVGDIVQSLICGRLLVMLGTMLQNGVALIQSLKLCKSSLRSMAYCRLIDEMEEEVLNGRRIGRVLAKSNVIPQGAAQMVSTAEESGKLGTVMQVVGEYYEAEGQRKIQEFAKLLEPTIIIVMGVVVAFVVASIMLPMLDISSSAGGH